jgi:hypothetical protein
MPLSSFSGSGRKTQKPLTGVDGPHAGVGLVRVLPHPRPQHRPVGGLGLQDLQSGRQARGGGGGRGLKMWHRRKRINPKINPQPKPHNTSKLCRPLLFF